MTLIEGLDVEEGREAPVLGILQQLMFPVFDLRDTQIRPWCSELLLASTNILLMNMDVILIIALVLHLESSQTLDNEFLIEDRRFGLIGTHFRRV